MKAEDTILALVHLIPTVVIYCLKKNKKLNHNHEFALPVDDCLGCAVFLFDECCSRNDCLLLSARRSVRWL